MDATSKNIAMEVTHVLKPFRKNDMLNTHTHVFVHVYVSHKALLKRVLPVILESWLGIIVAGLGDKAAIQATT